ncbi:MAG TPA: glycosyl hydrolase, partial [Jiangellaceae bacterium]|nr:glycosyl hydrolase [Jiangellaceae bacterium]
MRAPVSPRRATRGRVLAGTVAAVLGVVMVTGCGTGSREELGPRVFGVAVEGTPPGLSQLGEIRDLVGKTPEEVTWYVSWSLHSDFPAAGAARTAASGAIPSLTWEPWDPAAGTEQPVYALDRITAGDHDAYIGRWAEQVRSYGDPVVIRFAHEMNADWYPWSEQVNGNGPGEYVAAWRHVVDIFRARQVWNVTWSWSPNMPYVGGTDLAELYPGD